MRERLIPLVMRIEKGGEVSTQEHLQLQQMAEQKRNPKLWPES